jgi:hypothetical protein
MVKVFLSYHHKDRRIAGRLKESLGVLGINVFLAHDDLEPSTEWQGQILRELRQCDVFMPLLTRAFRSSLWTDQETGIAFGSKKLILPLKLTADPYGFIGKLQAQKVGSELEGTCWKIAGVLASRPRFTGPIRDGVIAAFLGSRSFEESARRAAALLRFVPFSTAQLNPIVEGGARNHQIYGGWAARRDVEKLIAGNRSRLKRGLVERLREQAASWG